MNKKIAELLQRLKELFSGALEHPQHNWDLMGVFDKMKTLKEVLKEATGAANINCYFYVEDLFDDALILSVEPYYEISSKLLKIPYQINGKTVSFGSPVQVERISGYHELPGAKEQGGKSQAEETTADSYQLVQGASPYQIPLLNASNVCIRFDQEDLEQSKKSNHSGNLKFKDSVVTTFEAENSQGHWYPKKVWENNLVQMNQRAKAKTMLGEADHPEKPSVERQCIKFDSFWIQGNEVHASGEILATQLGKDLMVRASAGIPVPMSSRGYGSAKLQEVNGKKLLVIQDDFYCETFDAVWAPSAGGSYIQPEDFTQSQKTKNPPEILSQSKINDKGAHSMTIRELLLILQGQIDLLKNQGQDVKALNEEFEGLKADLEQMQKDGVPESSLMTFLKPFGEKVGGIGIMKPSDPDKNAGIFHPSRTQAESVTQSAAGLTQAQQNQLAQLNKFTRNEKIRELVASADAGIRPFLQSRLEEFNSSEEVEKNFEKVVQGVTEILSYRFGDASNIATAGVGHTEKEKRYEQAPKTPAEAIRKLSEGIPEVKDEFGQPVQSPANPRWALERILQNMVDQQPAAMNRYLAIKQGRLEQAGEMTTADLTTANAALFPIIRQAYPRLIAHEIASIQPMQSDTGTVYFLDSYNEDGAKLNENHYYTYADNVAELGTPKKIKIKLSSKPITATKKALQTEVSYETIQDLLFKFGLDAQDETNHAAASEIAREWNNQILVDLAFAANTSGNVNFGMLPPSGYTQVEWDRNQMFAALQKASNNIYGYRYGEMTHLLCGSNTALRYSRMGAEGGFIKATGDEKNQIYAGMNKFGTINGLWQIWTSPILDQVIPDKTITLRKGDRWSDTPYVFAPYCTAVTPAIHSTDLSVSQAIMDRAGRLIVVPKALGTFTFQPSTTGTPI